jgi:hypothetical protein
MPENSGISGRVSKDEDGLMLRDAALRAAPRHEVQKNRA